MPVREVLPRDHTHLSPAFSPTHAPPVARRASAPASPRFITFPPSPTGCAAWPNGYLSEKRLVAAKPRPIFGDADRLYEATADAKLTCARGGVAMVGAGRGCTVCDSVQAIEPPRLVAASWWLGDGGSIARWRRRASDPSGATRQSFEGACTGLCAYPRILLTPCCCYLPALYFPRVFVPAGIIANHHCTPPANVCSRRQSPKSPAAWG